MKMVKQFHYLDTEWALGEDGKIYYQTDSGLDERGEYDGSKEQWCCVQDHIRIEVKEMKRIAEEFDHLTALL